MAALESQPLLGFLLKAEALHKMQFRLYHKHTLYYIFKADDTQTAQRYGGRKGSRVGDRYKKIHVVFLSFPDGLNRSGTLLCFSSSCNHKKNFFFLTLDSVLAQCSLNSKLQIFYSVHQICFNYVPTVDNLAQMVVASLDC